MARGIALALLVSTPSWAGSGAIEINQASVTAAGGFPFVISAPAATC